jgi:hypothetical protein
VHAPQSSAQLEQLSGATHCPSPQLEQTQSTAHVVQLSVASHTPLPQPLTAASCPLS